MSELTYSIGTDTWYWEALAEEHPMIWIAAPGWEFEVQEHDLNGELTLRLLMFDEDFAAFTQIPELFTALSAQRPSTLAELRVLLDGIGARDVTPRQSPHAESTR